MISPLDLNSIMYSYSLFSYIDKAFCRYKRIKNNLLSFACMFFFCTIRPDQNALLRKATAEYLVHC